jgi:hypothetical protein
MVLRVLDNLLERVLPRTSQRKLDRVSQDSGAVPSTLLVKMTWPYCLSNLDERNVDSRCGRRVRSRWMSQSAGLSRHRASSLDSGGQIKGVEESYWSMDQALKSINKVGRFIGFEGESRQPKSTLTYSHGSMSPGLDLSLGCLGFGLCPLRRTAICPHWGMNYKA